MSFVSPVFFVFFPVVLLLFRLSPERFRWALLLLASYLFYAWYNVWLLGLVGVTTAVSYGCGIRIETAGSKKEKRAAVGWTLFVCLSLLFVFKYLDFAVDGILSLRDLLAPSEAKHSFDGFGLLLPAGISFYAFQTMSYTFDVYRGTLRAERHLGYYALFVVFFPQLVAGPIERPADLLPQLRQPKPVLACDVSEGLRLIVRGYAKKLLIADYLAPFVDTAYGDPSRAGGAALVAATMLFALQIYCDFSGYSDIARGAAGLFGICLSENFRRPYRALSLRDFWRRWHISLTRWFTDYLYIPLGGSRKGKVRRCLNIGIVFLASGLWHGAKTTFLLWGAIHGIGLILETVCHPAQTAAASDHAEATAGEPSSGSARLSLLMHRALTFLFVCFSWIFFRASDLSEALQILRTIGTDFRPGGLLAGLGIDGVKAASLCLMAALLPKLETLEALPTARDVQEGGKGAGRERSILLYFLLLTAIGLCRCLALTEQGAPGFLYFQF